MINSNLLLDRLTQYSGEYECHITVDLAPGQLVAGLAAEQFTKFSHCCEALESKSIIIELDAGESPTQPMLCKHLSGVPVDVSQSIYKLVDVLSNDFKVSRVKVEASIKNSGIPQKNSDMIAIPVDCYFEHHVKIALADKDDQHVLRSQLMMFYGHLSKNALSKSMDGDIQHRFVTQRFYQTGFYESTVNFHKLLSFIESKNITILSKIQKFNIYDSNVNLDAAWMQDYGK